MSFDFPVRGRKIKTVSRFAERSLPGMVLSTIPGKAKESRTSLCGLRELCVT